LAGPKSEKENIDYNLNNWRDRYPRCPEWKLPAGWAQAANTPFKYWKQDANSEGGTHNPLIVYCPKASRTKWDPYPVQPRHRHSPNHARSRGHQGSRRNSRNQAAANRGTSLAYSIDDAKAPTRHTEQYYYIFGSRSIYKDGWKAELAYPSSFITGNYLSHKPFDENGWELYNLNEDYTERVDLPRSIQRSWLRSRLSSKRRPNSTISTPTSHGTIVFNGRIHRTPGAKSIAESFKDVTKSNDNQ